MSQSSSSTSLSRTRVVRFAGALGAATVGTFLLLGLKRALHSRMGAAVGTRAALVSKPLDSSFYGADVKLDPYYVNLLKDLPVESRLLFKHFLRCLQTPRPSGKLSKMRAMLEDTVACLGKEVSIDSDRIGNVVIRKAASKGFENRKGCIIQCHMDMVCTANQDISPNFDFDNDSIQAYIDGDWLKAKGTTLGADDGIGVAAGLALLEDPGIEHGPLEILITVDEETSMEGAMRLGEKLAFESESKSKEEDISKFLQNRTLINVDSEQEHEICIGCAGGFEKTFYFKLERAAVTPSDADDFACFELNISGLLGGHTGIQIHLGRANCNQLLTRIFNYVIHSCETQIRLVSIDGGNAANAIPSYGKAVFLAQKSDAKQVEQNIEKYWNEFIKPEFEDIEPSVKEFNSPDSKIILKQVDVGANVGCTELTTSQFISSLMSLPHGVQRMHPSVEELVQTSISFSLLKLESESERGTAQLFGRSPSLNEMVELSGKLESYARSVGCGISKTSNLFEGWDPNVKSAVLEQTKEAHKALFEGDEAKVYAVHAGLECGIILAKYPNMDCVSIGPTIHGAHSPDETLKISSVYPFYQWLRETVARVATQEV